MGRKRTMYGLLLAAAALTAGIALAQQDVGGDASEVDVRRRANLSAQDQQGEAERIQGHGGQISRRVQMMLDEARRERDIIRVTCLNDKLTQVNANLRTLDTRMRSLGEAGRTQDSGRRNHEFTVITVLGQKLSVLEQEANQCIGQDIFETGSTRITTTVDPATPEDDPEQMPEPPDIDVPFIPSPNSPAG